MKGLPGVLYLCGVLYVVTGQDSFAVWQKAEAVSGYITDKFLTKVLKNITALSCAEKCLRNGTVCETFFYNEATKTCRMHDFRFSPLLKFLDSVSSPGTEYYYRTDKTFVCLGKHVTGFSGKLFIPPQKQSTWSGAIKSCQSTGGTLTSVLNQEALTALKPFIESEFPGAINSAAVWVNARFSHRLNNFVWEDLQSIVDSGLWAPNEPKMLISPGSLRGQNKTECVWYIPTYGFRLDDNVCENGIMHANVRPLCTCD